MKIGDKLLCKKKYRQLQKNEIYIITDIDKTYTSVNGYFFTTNERNAAYENYLYEYFYTEKELRKKKLESL